MRALLLDFEGRIGRPAYWGGTALLVLASLPWVAVYLSMAMQAIDIGAVAPLPAWVHAGDVLVSLLLAIPASAIAIKRARDAGLPPWLGVVSGGLLVVATLIFVALGSPTADVEATTGDLLGGLCLLVSGLVTLWLGIAPPARAAPSDAVAA
jgi:uncharacterized membrane protein YhaH (DUF805 family)